MRNQKRESCYASVLFGGGLYRESDRTVQDWEGRESPVVQNLLTGKRFLLRRLGTDEPLPAYRCRILHPPRLGLAVWPCDLVELPEAGLCQQMTEHWYGTNRHPKAETDQLGRPNDQTDRRSGPPEPGAYAAVFPLPDGKRMENGCARLKRMNPLNWTNPTVRRFAFSLALTLHRLNQDGYIYNEFDPSRLLFREDGSLLLDFSTYLGCGLHLWEADGTALRKASNGTYPIEFADPAVIGGLVPAPDLLSQNHSLSAFLFFLCFGRLPYDGRLLSGRFGTPIQSGAAGRDWYLDRNAEGTWHLQYQDNIQPEELFYDPRQDGNAPGAYWNWFLKFRAYHRQPVFLFDRVHTENAPGFFVEDEELIALWHALPLVLKTLFRRALSQASAERTADRRIPGAGDWVRCLRRERWDRA